VFFVYSVSAYLMLLTDLLVYWIFLWIGLFGGLKYLYFCCRNNTPLDYLPWLVFVLVVSVNLSVLIPRVQCMFCICHVIELLLIHGQRKTAVDRTLFEFYEYQPNIKFCIGKVSQKSVNFLDLLKHRSEKELKYAI
jgi:hypothetical protein